MANIFTKAQIADAHKRAEAALAALKKLLPVRDMVENGDRELLRDVWSKFGW